MSEHNVHPTIAEFRSFINKHPDLRKEIRRSGRSWQEYYEKWVLLGEDDPFWDEYKENSTESNEKKENKTELFNQLLKMTENVDIEKVQKQVHQLSGAISTVQELIDQYQGSKKNSGTPNNQTFNWFRD
ncbi:YlbD family protein [Ornithinibacillus xuwenensis]|uniref:Spore coat protein YlbD n=1 Tax=Ornithinibacillus xuwenensis TaxID=3144668 RepID=A0ABU9XGC3_9BACI